MLDFLFALGQLICVIGLLYGLVLSAANYKYSGAAGRRYEPPRGHDSTRDVGQEELQIKIVPRQPSLESMMDLTGLRKIGPSAVERNASPQEAA